jgi:hypothetical protein
MWDLLRDMGETNVGGAAVIKGAQDNNADTTSQRCQGLWLVDCQRFG